MANPVGCRSASSEYYAVLQGLRRDLENMLQRVDDALADAQGPRPVRQMPIPMAQTYPPGYDFRGDPNGLREFLTDLSERVAKVSTALFDDEKDLRNEVCLRAAEARLLQLQTEEKSSEWETAVGVIRTLTRIVAEKRPGFVYGLASTHNTDWGRKIEEIKAVYHPW